VTISPFALLVGSADSVEGPAGYLPYPAYDLNNGYQARGLKSLLYVLALEEPGSFYLASLSRQGGGELQGLRRHYHVAVLLPYFEETGEFKAAVFESCAETSVEAVVSRGPTDFIHLIRVPAEPGFVPPPFP
jgi:hypothetical protein